MTEIKLNGADKLKRWEWERIQAKLFRLNISTTRLLQLQQSGSLFINELKNIFINFVAATAVINGEMTLGMMLAVQYIIGQLNAPITDAVEFIRKWQDASISLERIGEVHALNEEEKEDGSQQAALPKERTLKIENVSFSYTGAASKALEDLSFEIPEGRVTAVVGTSGSGKTTLLKLLLKVYDTAKGKIMIGGTDLSHISSKEWRSKCGVVMQDGYIFSDIISKNIALNNEYPEYDRMLYACEVANIRSHIESLPLGFNTKVGQDGIGLSQGQKQRLLIARAVYKDPEYLFFDEATSALDANNEKTIMENLNNFYQQRTVIVIAHRLSTVKNADQIHVLEKGRIIEQGNHTELVNEQKKYYELVKNQLELGN